QGDDINEVHSSLTVLAEERGWARVRVGFDNFFAWIQAEPLVRVSPDVYLLDDPPAELPKSFQTWLPGHHPPRWALEIGSEERKSWRKDTEENPLKYAQLGTRELVIFDPHAPLLLNGGGARARVPLQVYRRAADGAFVRVYYGNGPVHSAEIDATLVVLRDG